MEVMANDRVFSDTDIVASPGPSLGKFRESAQEKGTAMSPSHAHLHLTAARLRLELASTPEERQHAISAATELGMPLWQIEQFLDWLDVSRAYQESADGSSGWLSRVLASIAGPIRAGAEAMRRAGRRVFGSANPA